MNNSAFPKTVVKYLKILVNYIDTIRTICREWDNYMFGEIYVETDQDETCYLNLLYHELENNWDGLYKLETENVGRYNYNLHESQIDKEIVDCLFNIAIAFDNYINYIKLFNIKGDNEDVVDLLTNMREFGEFNKQFMKELESFYLSMLN
nr:MAG TPA: hypothetical protein [Caudoviricetes sp.]